MTLETSPPTMARLIALLEAGYTVDIRHSRDSGAEVLSLEHPAKWQKVHQKSLLLYADGSILGAMPREDGTHLLIDEDDERAFRSFVAAVPQPSWWDRNHRPFYVVLAWALLLGISLAGISIIDFLMSLLRGR